jgi:uncharacterized protein (TIGR01777 family)
MRIAIAGSSGLIGTALRRRLAAGGHDVIRLVRGDAAPGAISWDPAARRLDPAVLAGVDAVVNLSGAGIGDHRWTDEYKRQIRQSRVDATTTLAEALAASDGGPRVLLSGSAIGGYGDRGDEELDETSPLGTGFLADVVRDWEAATAAAEAGVRVVHLRTGIVLSPEGGALKNQLPLFKFGLGGRFGNGRQWQSWISIDDEVAAIEHLLTSDVRGPVNLTAPAPVTNREFGDTPVVRAGAVVRAEARAGERAGRGPAVRGPARAATRARTRRLRIRPPGPGGRPARPPAPLR